MKSHWGFDVRDTDASVRAADDFYQHAAGGWLDRNPIPENESRWGSFMILRYDTDRKLRALVEGLLGKRGTSPVERMVRDFYRSGTDMKRRNAEAEKPLAAWRKRIRGMKNEKDLLAVIAELHCIGVGPLFGAAVDQDSKDSTKYILHLYQDGLGMPERDYYLNDDAESKRVRDAYVPYIERMFMLLGRTGGEAKEAAATVMRIETQLAQISMTKEDRRDADKVYHKYSARELARHVPAIDWVKYFARTKAGKPASVIVMQPFFFAAIGKFLTQIPITDWKTYLEWHLVNDYAPYLSDRFVKAHFSFNGTVLAGMKVMKPLWRRVLGAVNGCLGEVLGRLYVGKHFPREAKRRMNELVDDLFRAYEARLKNLDWMTDATKEKALRKLKALNRKIGYPDRWKSYAGLTIRDRDYAGNVLRASLHAHKREMRKLGKPIDRKEWFMYPQTVNAYFAPNLNDIVFPAAILQPPFFSLTADDALNYGAIGTVIGHEITHGFDDQGSKYDHKGNLASWWSPEDRARFEKKAALVREQYDGYAVADGVKVNGQLTLGENIADFGGIAIAYDAYQLRLKKTGRTVIEGFTPEQRFFIGATLFDRENTRPEFEKMAALTDPHSPSKFRINGPLANIPAFYETFGVKRGDGMWRDESVRTTVW